MKIVYFFFLVIALSSCADGKGRIFIGCTPVGPVIKTFLGIPQPDSVDFIRWKLTLAGHTYNLHGNYGLGKQNTNGFINGGHMIDLAGELGKEGSFERSR